MEYLSDAIITIQSLMSYKSMAVAFILLFSIILFTPSKAFKTNPISSSSSSWRDLKLKPLLVDPDSSTSSPSHLSQLKKTLQLDDIRISKLLEDFSSPFIQDSLEVEEEQDTVVVQNKKQSENVNSKKGGITHFCFLVHGYNGKPSDLLYLRSVMVDEAVQKIQESDCDKIVFHSCQTNYGKTSDGVEAGGERILQEIQSVIAKHTNETGNEMEENITVSLIGNSLGGLYSRYAVAKLSNRCSSRNSSSSNEDATEQSSMDEEFVTMDGNLKVHFNIFCTTATPHLGISGHTYFPIPRTAEIGIGKIMGQTGRDIFRLSNLIHTMCTCPTYLQPLKSFRKRIAYANAYKTDFVVPTETAAFLNPQSTYPHHVPEQETKDSIESDQSDMVIATFHTPQVEKSTYIHSIDENNTRDTMSDDQSEGNEIESRLAKRKRNRKEHNEQLLHMSTKMDELGWKKVIVDVREHMPLSIKIPSIVKRSTSSNTNFTEETNSYEDENSPEKSQNIVESRNIANRFSSPPDKLAFPLGHNTLVAVEKQFLTKTVFQGGRPVMDGLAREIVDEILAWDLMADSSKSTS